MMTSHFIPSIRSNRRSRELRNAVVESFCRESEWVSVSMEQFTEREWSENLTWLDTSGLALYFVDRLFQLRREELLPKTILDRLLQNLVDNRAKTATQFAEASTINRALEQAGVLFANLKGITLTPHSVSDPSLRLQLDLDLLVCTDQADIAAEVLDAMGYARTHVSGGTWEFKADGSSVPSFNDLYKAKSQRAVEMHLSPAAGLLERIQVRNFASTIMPVLSPPDLYIQQAIHLFKHLRSSFTRASWVLEYRRHMLARNDDGEFWRSITMLAASDPEAHLALAVASLLVVEVFGDKPNDLLAGLIESALSPSVRLWVRLYGRSTVLADFPGTKLYLLLEAALDSAGRRRRASLLPLKPPPMITLGSRSEGIRSTIRRARTQLKFVLFRLRFHCIQGALYVLESIRFRRLVARRTIGLIR